MIPASRIRRALCHPDPSVVSAAHSHLLVASTPAPLLRVSDLIAELRHCHGRQHFAAAVLPRLPVTKYTARAIRLIAVEAMGCAQEAMLEMDWSVVPQLWIDVELSELRHIVAEAVRHSKREFWSLWRSFIAIADDEHKEWENHRDLRVLRAAMAMSHPRDLSEHLCAALAAPERFSEDARIEVIRILHRHPDRAALDGLMSALELDDSTADEAVAALGRLGTTEVVRRIVRGIRERHDACLKLGPQVLAASATRESERALHQLLLEERGIGQRTVLADAICAGFVTRGFAEVLRLVVRGDYAFDLSELDQRLWVAATATGWQHPEIDRLAESIRLTTLASRRPLLADPSSGFELAWAGWN